MSFDSTEILSTDILIRIIYNANILSMRLVRQPASQPASVNEREREKEKGCVCERERETHTNLSSGLSNLLYVDVYANISNLFGSLFRRVWGFSLVLWTVGIIIHTCLWHIRLNDGMGQQKWRAQWTCIDIHVHKGGKFCCWAICIWSYRSGNAWSICRWCSFWDGLTISMAQTSIQVIFPFLVEEKQFVRTLAFLVYYQEQESSSL